MIKPTLLASSIALLVAGCGGGGGGGGSTPAVSYFKVSFVNLASVPTNTTSSNSSCLVYDYDDVNNPTSKVIGYPARPSSDHSSHYSIVIHNQDGSVVSTYWNFVHAEKLSFKKNRTRQRTRPSRRRATAQPVAEVSKPNSPFPPGLHR